MFQRFPPLLLRISSPSLLLFLHFSTFARGVARSSFAIFPKARKILSPLPLSLEDKCSLLSAKKPSSVRLWTRARGKGSRWLDSANQKSLLCSLYDFSFPILLRYIILYSNNDPNEMFFEFFVLDVFLWFIKYQYASSELSLIVIIAWKL